jgi:hypothetical protein
MKYLGDHTWEATEPVPLQIGMPVTPPIADALQAIREAVAQSGATEIYWFWVSINGDQPHLGLAISPADDAVAASIGRAVEPLWNRSSPANPVFDIFRLGEPNLDRLILEHGEPLHKTDGQIA